MTTALRVTLAGELAYGSYKVVDGKGYEYVEEWFVEAVNTPKNILTLAQENPGIAIVVIAGAGVLGMDGKPFRKSDAPKGIGPDDMIPEGISLDIANPKYRQFKSGDNILEYAMEGGEITVDWVSGKNASLMMKTILEAEGAGVTRISGYATDKLRDVSNAGLQRLGDRMAKELGTGWKAAIEIRGNRRFLVFTK